MIRRHSRIAILAGLLVASGLYAGEPLIGYTELRTNLPGGRHANVRTMRAVVAKADGTGRRVLVEEALAGDPNAWTQFAGWSPDGKTAIVSRGWNDPENARWEEEHRTFRMEPGKWLLDTLLVDLESAASVNVTARDRVSHYNAGVFFRADGRLGFTPLIDGVSKPFVMDRDGSHKQDVSGGTGGFAYGYSASPDGKRISYHENYQVFLANADGTGRTKIETGHPFNFGPAWSPDGRWLLFLSGVHGRSNPHVVHCDGTGLRKLVDLNGYQGWTLFLDVDDYHQGSSDLPVWSIDGKLVFYSAKIGANVELFQTTLDGQVDQLTRSAAGTLHYHAQPSPDGMFLAYGSKRDGVRQLFTLRLSDRREQQITDLKNGHGAMWPHWQPTAKLP